MTTHTDRDILRRLAERQAEIARQVTEESA